MASSFSPSDPPPLTEAQRGRVEALQQDHEITAGRRGPTTPEGRMHLEYAEALKLALARLDYLEAR